MDEIYNAYFDKIYHWAIKKTNNREDAEDLTNTVFLSIFEYLNKNVTIKKVDNFIWKVAYNLWCTKAKDYIKDKNSIYIDENYSPGYEVNMVDKIIYKEIVDGIDAIGLTQKEKQAFDMFYINDLSIKEISKKLATTENNIKYFLYSARKKVKEKYYD